MKRIIRLLSQYDAPVWIRFFGGVLCATTTFMLRPFFVLYLYDKLGGSVLLPLLIVGLQPVAGILLSLWGGSLADRYGRKPIMLISLLIQTLSMAGFMFADNVWEFALLSFLNGLGMPMFLPAANAQIADIVPPEKRGEVFALLHTAVNVGGATGPLLGLLVYTWSQSMVFAICAASFLIFAVLVWWKVPETLPKNARTINSPQALVKISFREHQTLFWLTLFAMPVGLLYSQVETTFPLHLKQHFENYTSIFAWLMTINSVVVISLMVWIAKKTENKAQHKLIFASYMLFAIVGFGYGFAPSFLILILVELVFTFAEIIGITHLQKFVSIIAPPEMRGRYNSIFGMFMQIPKLVGPLSFGLIFKYFGGEAMFSAIAFLFLVFGFAQYHLIQNYRQGQSAGAQRPTSQAAQ